MALTDRYEPAGADIVSEEIDGEVIIVNLKNGNYYSLSQSATVDLGGHPGTCHAGTAPDRLHRRYSGESGAMAGISWN